MPCNWLYPEGHRFDIPEGVGCVAAGPNTFLSILLNTTWPIPIGFVSALYAILALCGTLDHTKGLKQLWIVEPALTMSRYHRLMALAAVNVLFTLPLTICTLVINLRKGLYPYRGFADLHTGFGRVNSVAAVVWQQKAAAVAMKFRAWRPILCALFFFLIFGFTTEARAHYKATFLWTSGCFGIRRRRAPKTTSQAIISRKPCIATRTLDDSSNDGDDSTIVPLAAMSYQKSAGGLHQAPTPALLEV